MESKARRVQRVANGKLWNNSRRIQHTGHRKEAGIADAENVTVLPKQNVEDKTRKGD